jgi:DNA-binding XRE family transcriptional regulator
MSAINHFLSDCFESLSVVMIEKEYKDKFEALGKQIRKFRIASCLTQVDIEVSSHISRADISKIENGLKNVELLTIIKIADALDVQVHDLFKPEEK